MANRVSLSARVTISFVSWAGWTCGVYLQNGCRGTHWFCQAALRTYQSHFFRWIILHLWKWLLFEKDCCVQVCYLIERSPTIWFSNLMFMCPLRPLAELDIVLELSFMPSSFYSLKFIIGHHPFSRSNDNFTLVIFAK